MQTLPQPAPQTIPQAEAQIAPQPFRWTSDAYLRLAGEGSQPEPDAALIAGEPDDYRDAHPRTALLVVEISDSTLAYDRGAKARLYAAARIPEYWIVNLIDRLLEVHREPTADATSATGWSYAHRQVLTEEQSVAPLAVPTATVPVAALLPRRATEAG